MKKIISLLLIMALVLTGFSVNYVSSNAAELNDDVYLPSVMDSDVEIPVNKANAIGEIVGEEKGATIQLDYNDFSPAYEDLIGSWSYRHKFVLEEDSFVDITSFVHLFSRDYVGDVYTYLSTSKDQLGVQLHTAWCDGDLNQQKTSREILLKGTYYITLVIVKDNDYMGDSDFTPSPYYTLKVKRTLPINISTDKVYNESLGSEVINITKEDEIVNALTPTYPLSTVALYRINVPQDVQAVNIGGTTRNSRGEGVNGVVLSLLNSDFSILYTKSETYNSTTNFKYQNLKAGDYYIKVENTKASASIFSAAYNTVPYTTVIPTPRPTAKPVVRTPTPTVAPTKAPSTVNAVKALPTLKLQILGNKRVKTYLTSSVKGVSVQFKWKGKIYKGKTNKRGVVTFKLKKKLQKGKKLKLTYTKKGYEKRTVTYRLK